MWAPRGQTATGTPSADQTGENVARAKRTARADARRRHRAEQLEPQEILERDASTPVTRGDLGLGTRAALGVPTSRQTIGASFRMAFRPLDWRADVRLLPQLVRHRSFWVPALLILASTALFAAVRPTTTTDWLSLVAAFLFQYFIVTPGIGAVFIAGFLAPRGSWLIGALVGLISATCYSILIVTRSIPLAPGAAEPAVGDIALAAFVLSPVVGALFASAAAWYRRFLMLSNPNRGRSRPSANAGRRPDGRTRAAASKAGARR
jgi:hypothetical protein